MSRASDFLTRRFLFLVASTPEGRAHLLNLAAEAEGTDEGRFFDMVMAKVDEPDLARMVARHNADELLHQRLFREQVVRNGGTPHEVPLELRLLERVDHHACGYLSRDMRSKRDVAIAYLILQAIEERALTQFAMMEEAFRPHDPEAADLFARIARDEARHLKYCQVVARRYLPDPRERAAELARIRRAEAVAFKENSEANVRHIVAHRLVRGAGRRALWAVIGTLGNRIAGLPFTPWAKEDDGTAAVPVAAAA